MKTTTQRQIRYSRMLSAWLPVGLPLALITGLPGDGLGQTSDNMDHWISIEVEPVAVLAMTGAAAPSFSIATPSTPGAAPVIEMDDPGHRFLQFTSIVGAPGATRRITASHNGAVPEGFVLEFRIWDEVDGNAARGTLGETGDGFGWQTKPLSEVDQDVVWDIGSGFTGSGLLEGWRFTYRLAISNEADPNLVWSNLTAHTADVQVFLTLTEEEGGEV